jgi:hypothetical protein
MTTWCANPHTHRRLPLAATGLRALVHRLVLRVRRRWAA